MQLDDFTEDESSSFSDDSSVLSASGKGTGGESLKGAGVLPAKELDIDQSDEGLIAATSFRRATRCAALVGAACSFFSSAKKFPHVAEAKILLKISSHFSD